MVGVKKSIIKVLLLLILHGWGYSLCSLTQALDFLAEHDDHENLGTQRDVKIPVGFMDNQIQYVVFSKGEPLNKLSSHISQRRVYLGMAPSISLDQQEDLFQNFPWQIGNDAVIQSPMAGRVIKSFVQIGQQVTANYAICIVEAMKMQTTVCSHSSGEIRYRYFEEGSNVPNKAHLISLIEWQDIDPSKIREHQELLMALFPWATPPVEPRSPIDPIPPLDPMPTLEDIPTLEALAPLESPAEVIAENNPDITEANQPTEMEGETIDASPSFSFGKYDLDLLDIFSSNGFKKFDQSQEHNGDKDTSKGVQKHYPESKEIQFPVINHDLSLGKMKAKKSKNPLLQDKFILSNAHEYAPHEIIEASNFSLIPGMKFLCGFLFMSQLIFLLSKLSYGIWRRSPFSKIVLVRAFDLTKSTYRQNRPAQNRNRVRLARKESA